MAGNKPGLRMMGLLVLLFLLIGLVVFWIISGSGHRAQPSPPPVMPADKPGQARQLPGDELFARGDFKGARKKYLEGFRDDPSSSALARRLAYVDELLDDRDQARTFYNRAMELEPRNLENVRDCFEFYLATGQFRDADALNARVEQRFRDQKILANDTDMEIVRGLAGGKKENRDILYLHMTYKNLEKIVDQPQRISVVERTFFRERARRYVDLALEQGKNNDAIEAQGEYFRGLIRIMAGDNPRAIKHIRAAIELGLSDPVNEMNALTLAYMLSLQAGDRKGATALMNKSLTYLDRKWKGKDRNRLLPFREMIYFCATAYGLKDYGPGSYQEPLALYTQLRSKGAEEVGADLVEIRELTRLIAQSRAAHDRQKTEQQLKALQNVLESGKTNNVEFVVVIRKSLKAAACLMLGDLYRDGEDKEQALKEYRRAGTLVPGDVTIRARIKALAD